MKRIAILMIGCALLAAGCTKEIASVEETFAPGKLIIDIVPSLEEPETRDVKTGWEAGDKIYVFFDIQKGTTSFDYLTMTYDGSGWSHTFSNSTLESRLLSGSGGYLSALYFTYGTPTFTLSKFSSTVSRLKFAFGFDAVYNYGIGYYCCPKVNYTVSGGRLKAALVLELMPEDVQFFVPDIPADKASDFVFSCNQLKRRKVGSDNHIEFRWQSTEPDVTFTSTAVGSAGDSFRGYPYRGGIVFPGILNAPGTTQDYEITVTDTKGTSATTDDVPYIFRVSGKKLKVHDAVRLPSLYSGRWEELVYGHEYVDLGLPSGNLWATMNVDATKSYPKGSCFAWAEPEPDEDDVYGWDTYMWIRSGYSSPDYITKYTFRDGDYAGIWYNSSHQFIGDGYKTYAHCNYEDDPAAVQWGSPWHTPSPWAFQELMDNTTSYWVDDYNGVGGYKFVSKKDASKFIFMPATGYRVDEDTWDETWSGNYWTSSLYTDPYSEDEPESSKAAYEFCFNKSNSSAFFNYANRSQGNRVRAVIGTDNLAIDVTGVTLDKTSLTIYEGGTAKLTATVKPSNASNKEVMWSSSNSAVVRVDQQGNVQAAKAGKVTITVTTFEGKFKATCSVTVKQRPDGDENGHEFVDLGLPSGLKWATCNIGANFPWHYGSFYAWGETSSKNYYGWDNYLWIKEGETDWPYINKYTFEDHLLRDGYPFLLWYDEDGNFIGDGKTTFADYNYTDDAARQRWGGGWRTPEKADFEELAKYATSVFVDDYNGTGVSGTLFTSKINSSVLFFPAAGWQDGAEISHSGSRGCYWASSLNTDGVTGALWTLKSSYAHCVLLMTDSSMMPFYQYRNCGLSIRPVCN